MVAYHGQEQIEKALSLIRETFGPFLNSCSFELREDGRLLYLRVDVTSDLDKSKRETLMNSFKDQASTFLQSHFLDENGQMLDFGWMVNIYSNEWAVDVVLPEVILEE
ncbi:MAG: hypothetical protein H6858_09565 [Rhodospirillales bacterium]|nr:hypothetical protein [Alphaproteobacteria bacterium]MCB9977833.1 hypothetical protein [Rhodospirillales bacterium]